MGADYEPGNWQYYILVFVCIQLECELSVDLRQVYQPSFDTPGYSQITCVP